MLKTSYPDALRTPPAAFRKGRKTDRLPRRVTDANGHQLVQVVLKGGIIATLDAADFDKMMTLGISDQWCRFGDGKNHSYVGVWGHGACATMLMVSRLIVDAPRGQVVRFADRDPANLRRSNLVFATGFAKQRESAVKAGQNGGTGW